MKFFDFFQDIYDYFFESISIQERRFKSDYDLLRLKFIADHHSELKDPKAKELAFKDDLSKPVSSYAELCKNVINLLHPQNREAKRLDTDSKFKLLNVARREQILVYKNFECATRIKQILVESNKLDSWRKEAIVQLLIKYKDQEIADDPKFFEPVRTSLYEAAYIRDVHFDNLYYKSKIAKRTISFLNAILSILLITILVYSAVLEYGYKPSRQFLLGPFSDLWLVVLFGLLGAAFSTLLNLYKGDKLKNTIIKQIDAVNLTRARLVIGACAGLIVFLILNSNLITIKGFNEPIDPTSTSRLPLPLTIPMLSLIFIGGFTERLVLNFIDKLSAQAGNTSDDSNKAKELERDLGTTTQSEKAGNTNGKLKKDEETKVMENIAEEIVNKTKDDKPGDSEVSK